MPGRFSSAPIDFSGLLNIIPQYQKQAEYARQQGLEEGRSGVAKLMAQDGGELDFKKAINGLFASGDFEGGMKLDAIRQARENKNAMTPYQSQSLDIARERLAADRAPKPPVLPTGYQNTSDGGMSFVPGGPADPRVMAAQRKAQYESKALIPRPQADLKISTYNDTMDRLAKDATDIKNDPNLWQAVGTVGMIPGLPGSSSAVVKAKIEGLQARAGFAALMAMRDASKTGGAVGNVSNFEQQLFQQQMANINRELDAGNFQKAMDDLVAYTQSAKDRMGTAYQETYGEPFATTTQTKAPPLAPPPQVPGAASAATMPSSVAQPGSHDPNTGPNARYKTPNNPNGNPPTEANIAALKSMANDPQARKVFNDHFGNGLAEFLLEGGR